MSIEKKYIVCMGENSYNHYHVIRDTADVVASFNVGIPSCS